MTRKSEPVMTELEDVELEERPRSRSGRSGPDRRRCPHSALHPRSEGPTLRSAEQAGKSFLGRPEVKLSSLSKRRLWRGDVLVVNKSSIVLVKILKE